MAQQSVKHVNILETLPYTSAKMWKHSVCLKIWNLVLVPEPTILTASPTNTILPLTKVSNGGYTVCIAQRLGCLICCKIILASFPHPEYLSIISCWGTTSTQGEGRAGDTGSSFSLTKATTFSLGGMVNKFSYDILNTYDGVLADWIRCDVLYRVEYKFQFRTPTKVACTLPGPIQLNGLNCTSVLIPANLRVSIGIKPR